MDENEQILLGSSVGYSIAFLNPVAGLAFALERSKCKISIKFIVKLVFALVVTFIMQVILRGRIVSEYFITISHHMNYWLLFAVPVLVVCTCTVGLLLKKLFSFINKHINYQHKVVKIIIYVFVILIPLALKIYNPKLLGSGLLSMEWIFSDLSLSIIAIYGAIRIVFTLFSFKTSFTGGIGGSIIIMGAIIGRLLSGVLGLFIEMTFVDHAVLTISTALPFYGILTKEKYTSISLIFSFGNFIYLIAPLAVGYGTMVGVEQIKKIISKSIKTRKNAQKVA
jgi:H+/Cl- antiporter ClcA